MVDGLSSELGDLAAASLGTDAVVTSTISGLSVTTAKLAAASVTADKLGAASVTASKQAFLGTGSPTAYGLSAQTGTVTASDVAVWTSYGTAFAAAPKIAFGLASSGAAATQPGGAVTVAVGSFSFLGQSGLTYSWIAVGSGAI